ncbi:uncharacterized protein EI90DRAFT_3043840 [Cantharellus anzutake]|uniref:uncharacterized protein n=1 Tax=Cantharellus anzutake TaxID=1750568 RepID=UPI00190665D5|nr:uncharacterized protein EI90DRAFT_3043840 [Cantharellus anzutake]KAF8336848.1 hypothetical protein EI90DRAFT_3043840 [Cantharellus anzutake]
MRSKHKNGTFVTQCWLIPRIPLFFRPTVPGEMTTLPDRLLWYLPLALRRKCGTISIVFLARFGCSRFGAQFNIDATVIRERNIISRG